MDPSLAAAYGSADLLGEAAPLLAPSGGADPRRLLSAAIGRLSMRGQGPAAAAVRQAAGVQLEDQLDWGYSRNMVALDLAWNLSFVLVSAAVLAATTRERPSTPVREWIVGYALQCVFHVGIVCFDYRRRRRWDIVSGDDGQENGIVKKMESVNAVLSFVWWLLGLYWIFVGGQNLPRDAPQLYWLSVVFLAFDVFFAIFCIMLACVIGIALCCCLPCIIAFLYSLTGQEGASDDDLSALPKYRFCGTIQPEKYDLDRDPAIALRIVDLDRPIHDLFLPPDDSECCICLTQYRGEELHSLPCRHHFHSGCIVKWLRINATCPLCKYSIIRSDGHV